jgi:hypothetical protein
MQILIWRNKAILTVNPKAALAVSDRMVYFAFYYLKVMEKWFIFLICALAVAGCEPIQEKILGTYDIDVERGCSSCIANGPESMVFEDEDTSDGIQGSYLFEFQDGEYHAGNYDFLLVDTTLTIILYPDSASFQFTPVIGTNQRSDYRVVGNKIKEDCEGLFRNCVWVRRD